MNITCGANPGVNAEGITPEDGLCGEPAVAAAVTVDTLRQAMGRGVRAYTMFPLCADHEVSNLVMLKRHTPEGVELGVIRLGEVTDL